MSFKASELRQGDELQSLNNSSRVVEQVESVDGGWRIHYASGTSYFVETDTLPIYVIAVIRDGEAIWWDFNKNNFFHVR